MKRRVLQVNFLLTILALADQSSANEVLYSQLPLASADSFLSDVNSEHYSDDFALSSTGRVTSVRWWGTYLSGAPEPDNFTVQFFAGGAVAPNRDPSHQFTNLAITRTNSGLIDAFGDPIFRYEAPLPTQIKYSAGSTAYFSVLNNTNDGWFWQRNSNTGSHWFRFDDQDSWIPVTSGSLAGNLAYELIGVTPPPGDYNEDFVVNQNDFAVWKLKFGTSDLVADGNGNGIVDAADYVVWRDHLGAMVGAAASALSVPEPTSGVLLLAGAAFALATRCHKKRRLQLTSVSRQPSSR